MIERVDLAQTTYQQPPLRFEAGTPIIGPVIALKTALEFIKKTERAEQKLLCQATEGLLQIPGLKILGTAPEKGPILTFAIEDVHSLDLATLLDLKNIAIRSGHLCAQPALRFFGHETAARASFGLYNTSEEVSRFIEAVKECVSKLRG